MILCRLGNFWVNRLREMLVEHLLPVGLVAAKEHIAELGKSLWRSPSSLFPHAYELENRLVEGKLDPKQAVIFVDFGFVLVMQIVALQVVNFGKHCLNAPQALKYKKGFFS